MQDDLVTRVDNWLAGEGYPLEFRTAREFRRNRLGGVQGEYVRHPESGVPREIDVLSSVSVRTENRLLRLYTVVECKYSRDKPWVVFTSNRSIAPSACIAQTMSSSLGDAVMWAICGVPELHQLPLFARAGRTGHGGRRAFEGNSDVLYNALQGVVSNTRFLCGDHDHAGARAHQDVPEYGSIGFPLIVVDAPLLECYLSDDTNDLVVTQTDSARLHWRGAESWRLHATVDIVTAHALAAFTEQRRNDLMVLADHAKRALEGIERGFREKTTKYLPNMRAGTGRKFAPPLICALAKLEEGTTDQGDSTTTDTGV